MDRGADVDEVGPGQGLEAQRPGQESGHLAARDGAIGAETAVIRRVAALGDTGAGHGFDRPLEDGAVVVDEGIPGGDPPTEGPSQEGGHLRPRHRGVGAETGVVRWVAAGGDPGRRQHLDVALEQRAIVVAEAPPPVAVQALEIGDGPGDRGRPVGGMGEDSGGDPQPVAVPVDPDRDELVPAAGQDLLVGRRGPQGVEGRVAPDLHPRLVHRGQVLDGGGLTVRPPPGREVAHPVLHAVVVDLSGGSHLRRVRPQPLLDRARPGQARRRPTTVDAVDQARLRTRGGVTLRRRRRPGDHQQGDR